MRRLEPAPPPRSGPYKRYALYPVIYATSVAYYLIYYNVGISLGDEGIFVNSTLRIMDGQIPYRDFFYYPPGANYILAALFKLFGVDLLVGRLLWVSVVSANVLLTFAIGRRIMPLPYAVVSSVAALLVPGPWHKSLIPFFFLSSSALAVRYISGKGVANALLCGVLSGAVVYFRYDTAVFVFLSYMLLVFFSNIQGMRQGGGAAPWLRESASLSLGMATALIPASLFFLRMEGGVAIVRDVLFSAAGEKGAMGFPLPPLDSSLFTGGLTDIFGRLMFYMPVAVIAATGAVVLVRASRAGIGRDELLLVFLMAAGLFAYNQTLVRADLPHLLQSIQVEYILVPYLAAQSVRFLENRRVGRPSPIFPARSAVLAFLLATFGLFTYLNVSKANFYTGSIGVLRDKEVPLGIPGAEVYTDREDHDNIKGLVEYIRANTSASEPVWVAPFAPMLYVLSGRKNPTRYDGIFPATLTKPGFEKEYIGEIERSGVRLIVFQDMKFTDKESSRLRNYAPGVYGFIQANYEKKAEFGGYQVYMKKT